MGSNDPKTWDQIEAIRKRPSMYVGDAGLFGLIHYLVCPVSLLLERHPTRIGIEAGDDGFAVEADVVVPIEDAPDDRIAPFEAVPTGEPGRHFEGAILTALSAHLSIEVRSGSRAERLEFRQGTRESRSVEAIEPAGDRTTLRFAPDPEFFQVTDLDPTVFASFARRNSALHRGVRFTVSAGGTRHEFVSDRGIADLFDAVSAPYQIMHQPIRIASEDGPLTLEAVFAYQSWKDDTLWCFINNGRAVEGGTHEDGVREALRTLSTTLKPPNGLSNGVVGVVSICYPQATFEGCIKARIGNPELRELVRDLFLRESLVWLDTHPEATVRLRQLRTFTFPDWWTQ
ncbi:hypothetical protein [Tautonia rosea]|uniref:hypothetical protein n=1 Tax=Tautonia rosea TaxID=2728037 RepID=UPI001473C073|nr:hypothetical protein [Tautonia rosea]